MPFILQYTICVSAQKIELEHQVCDKEVASRKLASEIAHLNKKKAMDETVWTEIGKTRGIHSRRFYCLDFIIC